MDFYSPQINVYLSFFAYTFITISPKFLKTSLRATSSTTIYPYPWQYNGLYNSLQIRQR